MISHRFRVMAFLLSFSLLGTFSNAGAEEISEPSSDVSFVSSLRDRWEKKEDGVWFIYLQMVNAYPRLEREKYIGDIFDPIMHALAPGYNDVATVQGLRDSNLLWVPQFGAGKVVSEHWVVYFQAGWTAGKVRTKANDTSIFLLPLHTDLEIKRGAASVSFGANFYPLGVVKLRHYETLRDRVESAKFFVGLDMTWTYAMFRAKAKVGFRPLPNLINLTLSDSWYLPSLNPHFGFEIPLNDRNSLASAAGYNVFFDEKQDFEGVSFTFNWNHFFRRD